MSDVDFGGGSARLTLDTGAFRAGINTAVTSLSNLEPVVARQWWGLQNLSKAFGAVGAFVAAGFTVAINEAIGWESALVGIQRTTGASNEELAQMETQLRKVAETTPIAVSELANLAEQAGALGVANTDIPEFVRVLGNLIASTNLTTADVDDLARVLNVLQVPVDSFDRFASTLLDVGRNTAATETEILSMAKRFAPAAAAAGVLADQVLAISAAVLSLGPRAEAGGTAVNKTFYDMATAITKGGDDLTNFASISGKTSDQFVQDFQRAPAETFAAFVTGLGSMNGGLIAQEAVLRDLGITEVRQQQALIALSEGTKDVGNEQHDLNAILALAHQSWVDNTALVEVAKQRYGTTAAQLTILRNEISAAANDLGKLLLPAIKIVIGVVRDFIFGFTQLPPVLQIALGAVAAIIGGLSLLAGGILALIGPLVLMMQTWRALMSQLGQTSATAAAASEPLAVVAAEEEQVAAMATIATEQLSFFNTELALIPGAAAAGTTQLSLFAAEEGTVAAETATVNAALAGGAAGGMAKFGKAGLVVAGILSIAAIGMTLFGHKAREAADATDEAVKPNLALVDALEAERAGTKGAADEWLLQQITMSGTIDTASKLGGQLWGLVDVLNVIRGVASFEQAKGIIDSIKSAADAGDAKAGDLLKFMIDTNQVFRESESAAGQLRAARGELGIQNEKTAATEHDLADSTDDTRRIQEDVNQATIDAIDAYFGLQDAILKTQDAQDAYNKALDDAAHADEAVTLASWKVVQAQQAQQKALDDMQKAYDDLANAREEAAQAVVDAQDKLLDANDKYLDSLDKIKDDEKKLNDLRNQGHDIDEITRAVNKLADAQLRLRHSEQAVKDAEWQLAFLRGEGASQRAIEDAELTLADARQSVKDDTQNVSDAEKDLEDARAGADPADIAKAERDLAKDRRDSADALRDINQRERDLQKARDDAANDTKYKEAERALVDTQVQYQEAIKNTRDAQRELWDLASGSLQRAAVKAQQDLEKALVDQAKAATEVDKQQALMRGEFYDTGRYAHDLAGHLGDLFGSFPSAEAQGHVQNWIDTLNTAINLPDDRLKNSKSGGYTPDETAGIFGLPNNDDINRYLQELGKGLGGGGGGGEDESILDRIIEGAFGGNTGSIVGGIAGGILGSIFGPGGTIAGFIIGSLIGSVVGGLIEEFWPEISGFFSDMGGWLGELIPEVFGKIPGLVLDTLTLGFAGSGPLSWLNQTGRDIVQGLWDGFSSWFTGLFGDIGSWLYDNIVTPIKESLGISSPSSIFADIGADLMLGLFNGLVFGWGANIVGWLGGMFERFTSPFTDSATWLASSGWNLVSGLWNGFSDQWDNFWDKIITKIPGWIGGAFTGAETWLLDVGWNIIVGLWNGIVSAWNSFVGVAGDFGSWVYDNTVGRAESALDQNSPSKEFHRVGAYAIIGLANGLNAEMDRVRDQMDVLLDTMTIDPKMLQGTNTQNVLTQFATEDRWRDLMTQMSDTRGAGSKGAPAGATPSNGDTFIITGADERSALDISEEVMFKKTVRL